MGSAMDRPPERENAGEPDDRWYRLMVESANDFAIFSVGLSGDVLTWNPGSERMFGYAAGEIIGEPSRKLFTPEDQISGEFDRELSIAASEGRARDDRWHVRRDGSRFWANGLLMGMRDEERMVRGFVKVIQDRTAEKRVEEALRRSEDQFARVFLGNPAAMAVELRDSGRLMLVNEQFLQLTGYWRSEALGMTGDELNIWAKPRQREAAVAAAEGGGPAGAVALDIRTKGGEIRPCIALFQLTTLVDTEALLATYIDVTGVSERGSR